MAVDLSEFLDMGKPESRPCPASQSRDKLLDVERDQFDAACTQPVDRISNVVISKWLAKRGEQVSWQTIAHHRKGSCGCSRDA